MFKPTMWIAGGLSYCAVYAAVVSAAGEDIRVRVLVGNIGLLVPPLAALWAVLRRRHEWRGCHLVFWDAIAGWAALWFIGQVGWFGDEAWLARSLPWFTWHILLQLMACALPLVALLARPHRGTRLVAATTTAIDVWALDVVIGFMCWVIIMAPGTVPDNSERALSLLVIVGVVGRIAATSALLWSMRAARGSSWRLVYQRLGAGVGIGLALLVVLSLTGPSSYQTGSLPDVGMMMPFWFAAWAAADAPASEAEPAGLAGDPARLAPASALFAALVAVPVVGYGVRYLQPFGEPVDRYREIATAVGLTAGLGFTMVRIVVERQALGRALRQLRILAAAFEQTEELILIVRENSIRYVNAAFCRATGYTRHELEALSPADLVAPDSRDEMMRLTGALKQRQVARASLTLTRKSGETFQTWYAAAPIVDASERVSHFVCIVRDMTDELKLREQLVRGERMSAVGELVAGVVQEIDAPLQSALDTLTKVLDEAGGLPMRAALEGVRDETARVGTIVRNLRAFVRQPPAERLVADLNDIVRDAAGMYAHDVRGADPELRTEYGAALPLVFVDRDSILQVVLNLLTNARHASATGGTGLVTMRTSICGADAALEVIDDGQGIPAGVESRVFEPFFTTKASAGNSGLGLPAALGIAKAHGGTLEIVPRERGTCFRLTLPGAGFAGPANGAIS